MNAFQTSKNPPAGVADGLDKTSLPGGIDSSKTTPNANISQAQIASSPAVAAAIQRAKARTLAIKRGSIASLANMAGASLDGTIEALENVDDDVMLERGKRFIENARAFKKLLADFRDARRAGQ
jgi:hypothetical protein